MNLEAPTPAGSGAAEPQEDATCDLCGRFGAYAVAGRWLCPECYTACGSCCPEFGAVDAASRAVESTDEAAEPSHQNDRAA